MMAASAAVPGSSTGRLTILLNKKDEPATIAAEAVQLNAGEGTDTSQAECFEPLERNPKDQSDDACDAFNDYDEENGAAKPNNNGSSPNRNLVATNKEGANAEQSKIPNSAKQGTTIPDDEGISSDDTVDSALLAALSDPRERFGLLRLEQTLCDFMKDTRQSYIEVGGPCNSVVIYPQHFQQFGEATTAVPGGTMTPPRLLQQQQQQQPNGKQSRFQRLCLHRLADRFNIVRETGSELEYCGGPGLIRLVKMPCSLIPKRLLIDLSVTEYERDDSSDVATAEGITRSLSGLALDRQPRTPNRKMKIMKRSSSGFGSTGSLSNKSNNTSVSGSGGRGRGGKGVKGKNLSDKEKAYAEARARIFNDEQATVNKSDNASSSDSKRRGSAGSGNNLIPSSAVSSAFSSTVTSPSTTPPPPALNTSSQASWSPSLSETADVSIPVDNAADAKMQPPQDRIKSKNNNNSNRPAAVAGGGVSKVTWRNRRQEESDPDFQTRHLLPQQQLAAASSGTATATGWNNNGTASAGGGVHEYVYHATTTMTSGYHHASQNYYAGAAPQQAPPPTFYPAGPTTYYHSSMQQQQQQQQVAMMSSGNGGTSAGWSSSGRGAGRGGYGSQQRSYSDSFTGRGQGATMSGGGGGGGATDTSRRPANINSNEEFPALG